METIYPPADRSMWFATRKPGVTFSPEKVVLHTTEGSTVYDYNAGGTAPTFTVDTVRGIVYQHYPLNMSARALVNKAGGVETNLDGAVQIEVIGTCDPKNPLKVRPYLPTHPVAEYAILARLLAWIATQTGIPLVATPRPWLPYPDSSGSRGGQRMTYAEWDGWRGICGHQHVPENDHGDPGAMPVPAILTQARAIAGPGKVTASLKADPRLAAKFAGDLARELCWGAFPLPTDHWFGREATDPRVHSGKLVRDERAVRQVQRTVGATADAYYGPGTEAAVRRWQAANGLTADGRFGARSWAKAAA